MIKIKETKSVIMTYNPQTKMVFVAMNNGNISSFVEIPMKSIFQVQRGLTSAIQRFYRKHDNSNQTASI